MSCGADTNANALMVSLLQGKSFDIPYIDLSGPEYTVPEGTGGLYDPPSRITNEQLTTRVVGGDGVFDALMAGIAAHLKKEYDANRISGAQYTEAFVAAAAGAMGTAAQFLLGRDQAYWASITAQLQARALDISVIVSRVQLATTKAEFAIAKAKALTAEAEYALMKIKLSTEDQQYCLLKEQTEAQRAQTLNTRTDGETITGTMGKQKDLYTQQITSYQRDAEVKAAKMFIDTWITQKTIDEGLPAPTSLSNASINTIMRNIKINNTINTDPGPQPGE